MADSDAPGSIPDFKPKSKTPRFATAVLGFVIGAGATGAAGYAMGFRQHKAAPRAPQPVATASASAKPVQKPAPKDAGAPPADAAPPRDPMATKAAAGDAASVKAIEALPLEERTAEQIVALASASTAQKRAKVGEITHKITLLPKFAAENGTRTEINGLAADPEVADDLVLALAALPGELGPDLLYKIGPGSWQKTPAKPLASDVLYAKDVRPKASKALGVYLDLAREKDCDKVLKLLDEVEKDGDSRSLRLLDGYRKKTGCGPKERDDCWACLRDGDALKNAVKEASKRKAK